jgi:hypothetical protein
LGMSGEPGACCSLPSRSMPTLTAHLRGGELCVPHNHLHVRSSLSLHFTVYTRGMHYRVTHLRGWAACRSGQGALNPFCFWPRCFPPGLHRLRMRYCLSAGLMLINGVHPSPSLCSQLLLCTDRTCMFALRSPALPPPAVGGRRGDAAPPTDLSKVQESHRYARRLIVGIALVSTSERLATKRMQSLMSFCNCCSSLSVPLHFRIPFMRRGPPAACAYSSRYETRERASFSYDTYPTTNLPLQPPWRTTSGQG